jgi:hypothetical protein
MNNQDGAQPAAHFKFNLIVFDKTKKLLAQW